MFPRSLHLPGASLSQGKARNHFDSLTPINLLSCVYSPESPFFLPQHADISTIPHQSKHQLGSQFSALCSLESIWSENTSYSK